MNILKDDNSAAQTKAIALQAQIDAEAPLAFEFSTGKGHRKSDAEIAEMAAGGDDKAVAYMNDKAMLSRLNDEIARNNQERDGIVKALMSGAVVVTIKDGGDKPKEPPGGALPPETPVR